jgi:hypothetical protein
MKSFDLRNTELFLQNSYYGIGKYDIPIIYRQKPDLKGLSFMGFHNTKLKDTKNHDKTIHFFMDDVKFDRVLRYPKHYAPLIRQYKQTLSPDSSLYTNMPLAKQIDSVFRRRYCSACWQSQGITVIPAVGWGDERSFEFCFDGIEQGAVVAVSALGSKKN